MTKLLLKFATRNKPNNKNIVFVTMHYLKRLSNKLYLIKWDLDFGKILLSYVAAYLRGYQSFEGYRLENPCPLSLNNM